MKALILRQDPNAARETSRALMDKGFQILCVETLSVAHALIRVDTVDLLVMDERVEGQLTHAIALSGERRNPYLSTILMTDRTADETDDLYALIPCLYALAGMDTSPTVIGQLALCAISNTQEAEARVARNKTEIVSECGHDMIMPLQHEPAYDPQVTDTLDEEPSYADVAFAAPAMAELTARIMPTPLERIDAVIMAEVAAVFRSHGIKDMTGPIAGLVPALHAEHAV